jgi:MFS transporter, NNP family, nitrate/nitrite transporter
MAFVAVMTGVALTAPPHWRGKAMGLLGAMSALATVFGAPFASSIGTEFGWRVGMRAFAVMALLGVAVFALFYSQGPVERIAKREPGAPKPPGMFEAFKIPVVWAIPFLGLTNAAGFGATFFVPSVVESHFHRSAETSSLIISTAYTVAIFVNPLSGWLADRYNRWAVLAGMVAIMIPACVAMNSDSILVFGIATSGLVALGHACANQVYPTAAELLKGRDVGPIMGIVALGGGIFGYLGPQALGSLRHISGGFALGWTVLTVATTLILLLILFLKRYADRNSLGDPAAS